MTTPVHFLSEEDFALARDIVGSFERLMHPDVTIAPDGSAYIYRWHVIPRNRSGNVYFHIQVQSDPERPLHDHPWDNTSVILSGGYVEVIQPEPPYSITLELERRKGDVVTRGAEAAHRLILPDGVPYTMTLFTTGPVRREWGFWLSKDRWLPHDRCIVQTPDGRSLFHPPEEV